ncbi:hypothetical protein FACS189442_0640 [Spirochaetia bacterium]|nr:hypothetical protein FACS189442_0640 [Spirochaetia bacterium]
MRGFPGAGSPFTDETNLGKLLDMDSLTENLGSGSSKEINVVKYSYSGDPVSLATQTYVVHVPITRMDLNLGDYMTGIVDSTGALASFSIPSLPFGPTPEYPLYLSNPSVSIEPGDPLFSVPIDDMAEWINSVSGKFGLRFTGKGTDTNFINSLKIYIPAWGIGTPTAYATGIQDGPSVTTDGSSDDLVFIGTTFNPKSSDANPIKIYVKLEGSISGSLAPELVFDWTDANVQLGDSGIFEGEFSPDLSALTSLGMKFNEIKGYIYADNLPSGTTPKITLETFKEDGITLVEPLVTNGDLLNVSLPTNLDTADLSSSSLEIPLTGYINGDGDAKVLKYTVTMVDVDISPGSGTNHVTLDMIIKLPLAFRLEDDPAIWDGTASMPAGYTAAHYVKLDMKDAEGNSLLPEGLGEGDLFGRSPGSGGEDDILKNLDSVIIYLKDKRNTLLPEDTLLVLSTPEKSWGIDFSKPTPTIDINLADLPNPFSPAFAILLKKEPGAPYALFDLPAGDDPELDFKLAVEVKTNLDYTIPLFGDAGQ